MTIEEYKQSIIEYMDFGIKHTDLQDSYSIGFRNGIRWCKSLIDGVEPIYDSTADTPQTDWYCYITEDRDTQVLDAWQTDCAWREPNEADT